MAKSSKRNRPARNKQRHRAPKRVVLTEIDPYCERLLRAMSQDVTPKNVATIKSEILGRAMGMHDIPVYKLHEYDIEISQLERYIEIARHQVQIIRDAFNEQANQQRAIDHVFANGLFEANKRIDDLHKRIKSKNKDGSMYVLDSNTRYEKVVSQRSIEECTDHIVRICGFNPADSEFKQYKTTLGAYFRSFGDDAEAKAQEMLVSFTEPDLYFLENLGSRKVTYKIEGETLTANAQFLRRFAFMGGPKTAKGNIDAIARQLDSGELAVRMPDNYIWFEKLEDLTAQRVQMQKPQTSEEAPQNEPKNKIDREEEIGAALKAMSSELDEIEAKLLGLCKEVSATKQAVEKLKQSLKLPIEYEQEARKDLTDALTNLVERQGTRHNLIDYIERHGGSLKDNKFISGYRDLEKPENQDYKVPDFTEPDTSKLNFRTADLNSYRALNNTEVNKRADRLQKARQARAQLQAEKTALANYACELQELNVQIEMTADQWIEQAKKIPERIASVEAQIFQLKQMAETYRTKFSETFTNSVGDGYLTTQHLVNEQYEGHVTLTREAYADLQRAGDLDMGALDDVLHTLSLHWSDAKTVRSVSQGLAQQALEKGLQEDGWQITHEGTTTIEHRNGTRVDFHWDKKKDGQVVIEHVHQDRDGVAARIG